MSRRARRQPLFGAVRRDGGFALVYALITVFILGAGAYALTLSTRALNGVVQAEMTSARDRFASEAATARALFALRNKADPLRRELLEGTGAAQLRVGEAEINLAVEAESFRIDLNRGSIELLQALFRASGVDDDVVDRWSEELVVLRAEQRPLMSIDALIGACWRLERRAEALRAATTSWTRTQTIDPRGLPPVLAAALIASAEPGLKASLTAATESPNSYRADRFVDVGPPVYRLRMTIQASGRRAPRTDVVFRYANGSRGVIIVHRETEFRSDLSLECR